LRGDGARHGKTPTKNFGKLSGPASSPENPKINRAKVSIIAFLFGVGAHNKGPILNTAFFIFI
jgi:hypothetical protein